MQHLSSVLLPLLVLLSTVTKGKELKTTTHLTFFSEITNDNPPEDFLEDPLDPLWDHPFLSNLTSEENSQIFDPNPCNFLDCDDPFVFAAGAKNNPNVLSPSQMLKADDLEDFLPTQVKEIEGLHEADVFDYLKTSETPPDRRSKLLNAIWSYRRKRRPDGTLLKRKSRICAEGSQQKLGIDYWDTHSPVVQWRSVRLILTLSCVLGLATRQVDYVQAFPQAPLDDDACMRIPQGFACSPKEGHLVQISDDLKFHDRECCVKLKRNLCGCKQASRNWFLHLSEGLQKHGFKASSSDPCLFLCNDVVICLHTDDCCIFANNSSTIDKLIEDLSSKFILSDEGDIQDFLGVRITKETDKNNQPIIKLTQTGLINDMLSDLNLLQANSTQLHDTPAVDVLRPDLDLPEFTEIWSYRSAIGKLNFLAQNTRPDISMAVHQAAKFCNDPRTSHGTAIKRIGCYLKRTKDLGLILRPDNAYQLDACCDSDFAGSFNPKNSHLRDGCLSRTGYVMTCSGCPIYWRSTLQSEITLSTCESEHCALSMCARALIPLRRTLEELYNVFDLPFDSDHTNLKNNLGNSVILEDDQAALTLANDGDKCRPRTKHLSLKWHHFRDQIKKGWLQVKKVDTKVNWADIFTKPLPRPQFVILRGAPSSSPASEN